ncbi:MAG: hypothetical protein NWQ09_05710 [Nonlabens sp.]|nr:hypothetical protein [Nonlabens sp.]
MKKFVFAAFFVVCSIGFASATVINPLVVSELENNAPDDAAAPVLEKEVSINLMKVEKTVYGPNCFYSIVTTVTGPDGRSYTNYEYFSTYAYNEGHCNRLAGGSSVSLQANVGRRVGSLYYSNY